MKISELDKDVKVADFENFFDIYEDDRGMYRYNLNSSIYFDGISQHTYRPSHDMFWTTISYEIYGTTRLWWLLMKLNNVSALNMFECVKSGDKVQYIRKEDVQGILESFVG